MLDIFKSWWMDLGAEGTFNWNISVFCTVLGEVVFTKFDTSGIMVAMNFCVILELTLVVLWVATVGFVRFLYNDIGVEYRFDILYIIIIILDQRKIPEGHISCIFTFNTYFAECTFSEKASKIFVHYTWWSAEGFWLQKSERTKITR